MRARSIRASVHPNAMKHVSAFFNAGLDDMLREVFQNARRAGATRIDVETSENGIRVRDNGCGISDPEVLLTFGRSGWGERHAHERPAGMGMYALAGTRCTIASRAAGSANAWKVELGPDHYQGKATAQVTTTGLYREPGTEVSIQTGAVTRMMRESVRQNARYLPVTVYMDGVRAHQERFEEQRRTLGVDAHDDVSFIVVNRLTKPSSSELYNAFHGKSERDTTRINFHGHVIKDTLHMPYVHGTSRSWYAEVDVHDCPELELVLPARKEVVRNEFLEKLRHRAELAIYEVLDRQPGGTGLPYSTWKAGTKKLDREMRRLPAMLAPWSPTTPENAWTRHNEVETIPASGGVIVPAATEAAAQVLLQEAVRENDGLPRLYDENTELAGFPEYDAMLRIGEIRVNVTETDGSRCDPGAADQRKDDRLVRSVRVTIPLNDAAGNEQELITVASRIGFCNLSGSRNPGRVGILVPAGEKPSGEEIVELMLTAYYSEYDGDDESDTTQRARFQQAARKRVEKLLLEPDDALERRVKRALDHGLRNLAPKGTRLNIVYGPDGSCAVERMGDSGTAAHAQPG